MKFHTPILNMGFYDVYFLKNPQGDQFSLVSRDARMSTYLQIDDKFKIATSFDAKTDKDFFRGAADRYVGGTTGEGIYNFIYTTKGNSSTRPFKMEVVNFVKKSTQHKILFELPKNEKEVAFFCSSNLFYAISADDESSSLIIRRVNEKGKVTQKRLRVKVPEGVSKKRDKLSEYLKDTKVIQHDVETDFSLVSSSSKIFASPDKIQFVINESDLPTHLLNINLPTLTMKETFFKHPETVLKDNKGDIYVNSFITDKRLFSLILGKEKIHIASFDLETAQPLGDMELNEQNYASTIAQPAVTETRKGKRASEKEINSFRSVMKEMGKRTEGLMVASGENGQYIVTVGTYDQLEVVTGSSGGGHTVGPSGTRSERVNPGHMAGSSLYYTPGTPVYTNKNARYYTTTRFWLLMDAATGQPVKGKVPLSVPDQIKDFQESLNEKKIAAVNQFSIDDKQYLGYYDKDTEIYRIVEVNITK